LKVDVAICAWNSNKPWFKRCLASIKREIPLCHFITVDRSSNDGTVETIKKFFPEAIIIESTSNLAKARQEAIKYVDTKLFIFIDDDIELCEGWFKTISSHMKNDVGAISGLALPTLNWLKKFSLYSPKMASEFKREWKVGRRIYLSNTLIATDLVRDWSPSILISAGEDEHLSRHILKKGYDTILLDNLYVNHYGKWGVFSAKKNLWLNSGARLLGYQSFTVTNLIRRFFTSPFKGMYACIKLKEPLILPYLILSDFYNLKGWIQWNKYVIWKR